MGADNCMDIDGVRNYIDHDTYTLLRMQQHLIDLR